MELQLEKPKPKRKKIKENFHTSESISEAPNQIPEVKDDDRESSKEQTEEALGSWEDLHEHIENFESMYPSVPSGGIVEENEPEHTVVYPPVPLLTMEVENYIKEEPLISLELNQQDLYTPSAPPIQPQREIEATAPPSEIYLDWNPLPTSLVEKIYTNPLESEHTDTVAAFRSSSLVTDDDWLYRKLLEYEQACMTVDALSVRSTHAREAIKNLSTKYWTIKRVRIIQS